MEANLDAEKYVPVSAPNRGLRSLEDSQMRLDEHKIYLLGEFAEDYLERRMSRRDLLRRALLVTGSVPLAATSLLALGCGDSGSESEPTATQAPATAAPTQAPTATSAGVAENDAAIVAEAVTYPGPAGQLQGYLARPRSGGPGAAVVVIHENRGLVDHIRDVARRYAKEGIVALAVDMASRGGGSTATVNGTSACSTRSAPRTTSKTCWRPSAT
jgi:carboxymethylenebutenolidase